MRLQLFKNSQNISLMQYYNWKSYIVLIHTISVQNKYKLNDIIDKYIDSNKRCYDLLKIAP